MRGGVDESAPIYNIHELRVQFKCRRRRSLGGESTSTWSRVNRICWHPDRNDTLGLYTDGTVFKWQPFDDVHQELQSSSSTTPSDIHLSPDGSIFATSDVIGNVQLYDYEHLALLYHLSSEDAVVGLCFSLDQGRFYDIRGRDCNLWEPNALTRLADIDLHASEHETEAESTVVSSLPSEAYTDASDSISSLSVGP